MTQAVAFGAAAVGVGGYGDEKVIGEENDDVDDLRKAKGEVKKSKGKYCEFLF